MKAEELMKNNLIMFNGYVEKVASFDDSSITSFRDSEGRTYSYISAEPIPLTKEWFLRFGFEEDVTFTKGRVDIWHSSYNDGFIFRYGHDSQIYVEYVHQLQNLYFTLTGKELELKE